MAHARIHRHYKIIAIVSSVILSLTVTPALFYQKYTALKEKQAIYIAATPKPVVERPTLFGLQRQRLSYLLSNEEINALLKSYREDRKFTVDQAIVQRLGEKGNGTLQWLLAELDESFKIQYAHDDMVHGKRDSLITFAKYEYPSYRKDLVTLLVLLFAPVSLVLLGLFALENTLVATRHPRPATKQLPKRTPPTAKKKK